MIHRKIGGHSESTCTLKGGGGTQNSVRKRTRGGCALQRTYVRSCDFQTIITSKASKVNKTVFQGLYTQDRILIDFYGDI